MNAGPPGLNTAIASGAAFGNNDHGGPGDFQGVLSFMPGLNKAAGYMGLSDSSLGNFLSVGQLGIMNFLKARGTSGLPAIMGRMSEGIEWIKETGQISSGEEGGDGGNSGGSAPFEAVGGPGAGLDGVEGGQNVQMGMLGNLSPSPTPSQGRSEGIGLGA